MRPQAPYRPRHGGYVSEFEQFLGSYLAGHPDCERDQQKGWYLLWDKQVDLKELKKAEEDRVPLPPYYYPE